MVSATYSKLTSRLHTGTSGDRKTLIIAQTVFGILEVLEMVLSYCKTTDILNFEQTCQRARDIINASIKLQLQLYRRAAPPGATRIYPFDNKYMPGFQCGPVYDWRDKKSTNTVNIRVRMDPDGVNWPRIGKRLLDTFICQPPMQRVLVRDDCPNDDNNLWGMGPGFQMVVEECVRIRDVYRMAEKFVRSHDTCRMHGDLCYGPALVTYTVYFDEYTTEEEWQKAADWTARTYEYWDKKYAASSNPQWAGGHFDDKEGIRLLSKDSEDSS